MKHLFKNSKSYALLRRYTVFCHNLFYNEISVINKENVPENEPVIFAPNHQNALMDALAIICTLNKQTIFMARADIFKNKLVRNILYFLKIIPVYRIRDGIDQLGNNEESFNLVLQLLEHKKCIGIMPEGNHGDQRRLRPLKKGIARFAVQVQATFGKSEFLKIIPVGIDYSQYTAFRSKILIIYGEPIEVSNFLDIYALSPLKAINLLRERLTKEMKEYMLNIDSDVYYNLICKLTKMYVPRLKKKLEAGDSYYDYFQVEKIISDKLVTVSKTNKEQLEQLKPAVEEYISMLKNLRLDEDVFESDPNPWKTFYFDVIRYTVFMVFALAGTLFHLLPAIIIKYLSSSVKDTQFQSSFKFVLGMVIFPIYYLSMLALPIPIFTKIFIILLMPILGVLSYDYFLSLKRWRKRWRYYNLKVDNHSELVRVTKIRGYIIEILDRLI